MHHGRSDSSTEASAGRPESGFGRHLDALGSPWSPRDRLWSGIGAPKLSHPERVRCRFSLEPRATKARKQNLKKESPDPQRTACLLHCAVTWNCPHVFRNDFQTLHVQPFTVAFPQAHLVKKYSKNCRKYGGVPVVSERTIVI